VALGNARLYARGDGGRPAVYWMPVFRILGEGCLRVDLSRTAAHIKNVPGPQDRCKRRDVESPTCWPVGWVKASFRSEVRRSRNCER